MGFRLYEQRMLGERVEVFQEVVKVSSTFSAEIWNAVDGIHGDLKGFGDVVEGDVGVLCVEGDFGGGLEVADGGEVEEAGEGF